MGMKGGNTMPDLSESDLVPFHSRQVRKLYLLVPGQVKRKLIQFTISYFD